MIPNSELKPASYYVRVLRPLLPPQAFEADARHLLRIGSHLILIGLGYAVLRLGHSIYIWLPVAILIGHSLACLLMLAHDTSHGSVLRHALVKRPVELLLWGLNCIPPTLWRRLHNHTHHVETNTIQDTDRPFRAEERTQATWLYTRLFFPNRRTPFRHPLVFLHFITYIGRQLFAAVLPGPLKPSIVTFKPAYSVSHKFAIFAELAFIITLQFGIWMLMGGDWLRYVFAVPVALFAASTVAMAYIFTNHFLNPMCEHTDPLIGSTSVIVPRWVDWLHDNFSYHTEHHVFPGMNPRYYPQVSLLLQKHFPDRYHRIPFGQAWRQIWQLDEFINESTLAKSISSGGESRSDSCR